MSLLSLRFLGCYAGKVLIFTDRLEEATYLLQQFNLQNVEIIHQSVYRPLFTRFHFPQSFMNEYDQVIYLDADIVVQRDMNSLFDHIRPSHLYFSREISEEDFVKRNPSLCWHGDYLYRHEDQFKPLIANSGFFAFGSSDIVSEFFEEIRQYAQIIPDEKYTLFGDQPVFCYLLSRGREGLIVEGDLLDGKQFMTHGFHRLQKRKEMFIHCSGGYTRKDKIKEMFGYLTTNNFSLENLNLIRKVFLNEKLTSKG